MAGHEGYLKILDEMKALHEKKAADYGTEADPFANIRRGSRVGIEPWRGALNRAMDKVTRIERFCQVGKLENESFEDSLLDGAAYFLIALAIRRELSPEELSAEQPKKRRRRRRRSHVNNEAAAEPAAVPAAVNQDDPFHTKNGFE